MSKKKIALFGAQGHIGFRVWNRLAEEEWEVDEYVRRNYNAPEWPLPSLPQGYDSAIYCIGHCPPGGFNDAVRTPLSYLRPEVMETEIACHFTGVVNVFQAILPSMNENGSFIFMSSGITRVLDIPLEERPPFHFYHHIAAIAAQNALIEGMKMDPEVRKRNISIHKISSPAISDSPFHEGGPTLPVSITTEEVVDQIIAACKSSN